MRCAVICTTYNRPTCLARSLPQICAAAREVGAPVLVVDDGGSDGRDGALCQILDMHHPANPHFIQSDWRYLRLPENRGLAGALNIGLAYWLADPSIEAISYFQDDVDVDPLCIAACNAVLATSPDSLLTGHHALEHGFVRDDNSTDRYRHRDVHEITVIAKAACRATHLHAARESWASVMPLRSRGLGLPSRTVRDRNHPESRGTGSGVDWWIVRDSPNRLPVLCIPGLVRTFAWKREDSCWDNEQIAGEDPPLSRDAIAEWAKNREGIRG